MVTIAYLILAICIVTIISSFLGIAILHKKNKERREERRAVDTDGIHQHRRIIILR